MNIIFAGTPEFSLPALRALLDSPHRLQAVYTQPDRPAGRGRRSTASPVKQLAMAHRLPVCQPATLREPGIQAEIAAWDADLMVVVAYGLILPPAILALPRLGCVNIHASLLPRWRGAAPIQRAILAGDTLTGVTLMKMEAGLDSGPLLASLPCPIGSGENAGQLHDRLAPLGARLLVDNLERIEHGRLSPQRQDEEQATYADRLDKREAVIDWTLDAEVLARMVRAFNPWPVAETRYAGGRLRVWEARTVGLASDGRAPGSVLAAGKEGVDVACGQGVLRLLRIQSPGGRVLRAADFLNAHPLAGVHFASG